MMNKHQHPNRKSDTPTATGELKAAGFFVLRAPLLPLSELLDWSQGLQAATASEEAVTQALAADRARLRARLDALLARPEIADALFVASPDLEEYVEHWRREPDSKRGARVEGALVRYFARMCGRATPFGLFAATSLGRIGAETDLRVADYANCQRHTRLDMDYLFALVAALSKDPELRRALRYVPNSSLYEAAGRVRYVEARLNGKQRSYHLVAIEQTDCLMTVVRRATEGSATLGELAAMLVDDEITEADAEAFIAELIECQLLVPELALPVTGQEPIHPLIDQLSALAASPSGAAAALAASVLAATREELAALDADGVGAGPARYRAIAEPLKSLPAAVELPRLLQVDLVRPAGEAQLGAAVVREITDGVALVRDLFGRGYESELSRFRQAFTQRYEEREVTLVEALDDDLGLGFPTGARVNGHAPLLNGLTLGGGGDEGATPWRARESFLLKRLAETLAAGRDELALTREELEPLRLKDPLPWSQTISAVCKLAAASPEALARGEFQVLLEGAGGASGANLLGRFCHADSALHAEVSRYLRREEASAPDAVFAEIAHLPEGRIGNVLARPVLREYEIPYLGASGAPRERQLPVRDLLVSVRDGRLVLRSARLGREVMPRLCTAHNWSAERASVYKFLCALQTQNRLPGAGWDWGTLESAPFLPRVTCGRLVLAQARWLVSREELQRLSEAAPVARFQAVQHWRAERRLPRYVMLADHDNTLPVDWENVLSVDSFIHITKERGGVILKELWPAPEHLCARGAAGAFVHELIVPLVWHEQRDVAAATPQAANAPLIADGLSRSARAAAAAANGQACARHFAPGSEWLYAKLYCGTTTADEVLRTVLHPAAQRALAAGDADRWHFLRYTDPDHHLRIRFHGVPERLLATVWPRLLSDLAPLLADGRVWRVQLDTYEREIERYGGPLGMELAEQLFASDSMCVAESLGALAAGDAGMDERWRLALCGMDYLFNDFGFDAAEKLELLRRGRRDFFAEFHAGEALNEQLSERYRQERKRLEAVLDPARADASGLGPGLEILRQRSARNAPIIAALRMAEQAGQLTQPVSKLAWNFAHLHVNRMLRSAQRAQEMVLYDLLTRLHSARAARQTQPRPPVMAQAAVA